MDILVSYCVFIYRFYWVTCTAPVIIGNWRPSKCVLLIDYFIDSSHRPLIVSPLRYALPVRSGFLNSWSNKRNTITA